MPINGPETPDSWPAPADLQLRRRADLHLTAADAADVGVEGLVAKGASQRYLPGQRGWVKLRIHDGRCGLILGLVGDAGGIRVAGATHPLSARESAELAAVLVGADDHPWPAEVSTRQLGQFSREPVVITRVEPTVVVDVEADTAFEHGRWRHLTRDRRLRLDLSR